MRGIAGALMLSILLAAAVVLYLDSRSASSDFTAVNETATKLRTGRVEARSFDRSAAGRAIAIMEGLLAGPSSIASARDELVAIAREAASWAEAAPSDGAELHVAVSIRAAADELRAYASEPSEFHLQRARSRLESAKRALAGEPAAQGPVAGIQDRLDNIEQSQREQMQELNDALK